MIFHQNGQRSGSVGWFAAMGTLAAAVTLHGVCEASGLPQEPEVTEVPDISVPKVVIETEIARDAKLDRVCVRNVADISLASVATSAVPRDSCWILARMQSQFVPQGPFKMMFDSKTGKGRVFGDRPPPASYQGKMHITAPLTGSLAHTNESFVCPFPDIGSGTVASREADWSSPFRGGGAAVLQLDTANGGMARYSNVNRIPEDWAPFVVPAVAFFRANQTSLKLEKTLGRESRADLRVGSRLRELVLDKNPFIAAYACRTLATNELLTHALVKQILSQEEPLRQAVFVNILLRYTPDPAKSEVHKLLRGLIDQSESPLQIVGFALGLSTVQIMEKNHTETLKHVFQRSNEPVIASTQKEYSQNYIEELKKASGYLLSALDSSKQ